MQVSWIDPEHVRGLAEQLLPARAPAPKPADPWDHDSLGEDDQFSIESLSEKLAASFAPTSVPEMTLEEPPVEAPAPAWPAAKTMQEEEDEPEPPEFEIEPRTPEIEAIRLRLQAIRERATQAGIIIPARAQVQAVEPEAPAAAPAPLPPVEPPPATLSEAPQSRDTTETWDTGEVIFPASSAPVTLSFVTPEGSVVDRLNAFVDWIQPRLGDAELIIVDDHGDLLWGPRSCATLILSAMMAWSATMRNSAASACDIPDVIRQPFSEDRTLSVMPCSTRLGMIQVAVARKQPLTAAEVAEVRQTLFAAIDSAA